VHHGGNRLEDDDLAALVAKARTSSAETIFPEPITSLSFRTWPPGFPEDIATQRRVPYEARADAIMYRQVLAELGRDVVERSSNLTRGNDPGRLSQLQ
jgi:hypothetical protein